MPNLEDSLKLFGQMAGLLDDQGSIQWAWFGNPEAFLLGSSDPTLKESNGDPVGLGAAGHRDFIGKLLRELLDQPPDADVSFAGNYVWVPLNPSDLVEVGFVWSKAPSDLQLGIGVKAGFTVGGENVSLATLARIIGIKQGNVTPLFKDLSLTGTLAPPDFLKSIAIEGDTSPLQFTVKLSDLKPTDLTLNTSSAALGWDCLRLALFVVRAWIHKNSGADAVSGLVDQFFTLLDGPPAFPLTDATAMGSDPNFDAWANAIFPTTGSSQSVLAFLWRLRTLITGSQDSEFLSAVGNADAPASSLFFPLLKDQPVGPMPTNASQASGVYTPGKMGVGAWLAILKNGAGSFTLVLDAQSATNTGFARIPLAQLSGGGVSLPIPTAPNITALSALSGVLPFQIEPVVGGGVKIHLFSQTLNTPPLEGAFDVSAIVTPGQPVKFELILPAMPPLDIPPAPSSEQHILASIIQWITNFIPSGTPGSPTAETARVTKAVGMFLSAEIANPSSLKIGDLLKVIATVVTASDNTSSSANTTTTSIEVIKGGGFDFSVGLDGTDTYFHVKPDISYGPITVDQLPTLPMSIGKLHGYVDIAVDGPKPFSRFGVGFDDLRLGTIETDGSHVSGLIASLIPDLKQAPGFQFELEWTDADGVKISGSSKIPIQLTLGPLSLSQLLVDAKGSGLTVGINLSFQLSAITVSTYELGLGFDYKSNTPSLALNGLGLSFDGAGIRLSGLFLNNDGDYIGGAAVSIEDMFSLSAIGGYKWLSGKNNGKPSLANSTGGQASLFIFASLMAPLGGPPFFFVIGIAGGFGYNRMLPPATLMSKHPFFKIMSGQIPISTDPKQGTTDLAALDQPGVGFAPKSGDYWIAAGIQFISFGFINGKVIVAVAFGHDFSINVMGIASFGLKPVAYFEIDVLVTVDKEKFLLVAGVSPNSYLIHPDIFNLSGDFALGVWHGGEHAGDFLLSIGGYHPYFKAPDYYPQIDRVAVNATVFGFVHLSVQCFFACTPHALMAGASVSLSATFAGIGAGLDVYVDVFIQWDPFFIMAEMGVTLWFEFIGRHEIGVDLQIHTPPFGGIATVHLFIISFDVSFGDKDVGNHSTLAVADFFTRQLGVPAKGSGLPGDANVALFNTANAAGLVRIVFTSGRAVKPQADSDKAQDGITTPVQVSPEFSFVAFTHLPIPVTHLPIPGPELAVGPGAQATLSGTTNLPLCRLGDLASAFTVAVKQNNLVIGLDSTDAVADIAQTDPRKFPQSQFGPAPLVAQGDQQSARQAVSGIDTAHPAIDMVDGLRFNLQASPLPAIKDSPFMNGLGEEFSDGHENYPLPLGGVQDLRMPKSKLSFVASHTATVAVQMNASRLVPPSNLRTNPRLLNNRPMNPAMLEALTEAVAPKITSTVGQLRRPTRTFTSRTTNVATVPAGVTPMAPPTSPTRHVALASVGLRMMPAHATAAAAPIVHVPISRFTPAMRTIVMAPLVMAVAPATATAARPAVLAPPPKPMVTVISGQGTHLEISAAGKPAGTLVFAGQQTVRAIFMTAFGEPVADQYVVGNQSVPLPARSRNVLLIGEGMLTGAPTSLGCVGVEFGSSLYAIGGREFAGHGCVLQARSPVARRIYPAQTLTGRDVLPFTSSISLYLPPARTSSVLITIAPAAANPAAAPTQIRWRAVGGTLTNLKTAAAADRAAFVMDVQAAGPWFLDIDIGADWSLASAVLCNMPSAVVVAQLRGGSWNFVDDSVMPPSAPMSTTITLEVING